MEFSMSRGKFELGIAKKEKNMKILNLLEELNQQTGKLFEFFL